MKHLGYTHFLLKEHKRLPSATQFDSIKKGSYSDIFPLTRFLPESIRWLLSKDRVEQAREIIRKVADTNKVVISEEMLEDLTKAEEKTDTDNSSKKYTIIDLCRPAMLLLSLNVWFNW